MTMTQNGNLARMAIVCCALATAMLCGRTAVAQNLLGNPSFETPNASGGDVPNAPGAPWVGFGDPNNRFTTDDVFRTGSQSLKTFGPFFPGGGNGGTQKVAAVPGQQFVGEIYAQNFSADRIQGNNFGVYKIEFLDASMNLAAGGLAGVDIFESNPINAATPVDMWTLLGVGTAPAPAGTAFAQAVIVGVQAGPQVVGGAIFWDDASLVLVPEPTSMGLGSLALISLGYLRRRISS